MSHKEILFNNNQFVIYNDDCLNVLKTLPENSVDVLVTSPPYYNARQYSIWEDLDSYLNNMKEIFTEVFKKIKNYHNIVVNVGDVVGATNKTISSKRKIPLGAYFITMLEEIGFRFVDDIIWDKGEVQSSRNFVGDNYPYQKYPINCYEHILIFKKIDLDDEKPCCPVCNENKVAVNGVRNGIPTYECKNKECTEKSPKGRGKRFSTFSKMVNDYEKDLNKIDEDLLKMFRKDIIRLNPVIKINSKGENILNHTAPYPEKIPEYAIKMFSGVNDVVLDMFLGSGTTGIVAKKLNRNFIGIEKNKEYFEQSLTRIKSNV